MLYFNKDGLEDGGLIYDGTKNEKEHSSGLSLTGDPYADDQVMPLNHRCRKRIRTRVSRALTFNNRTEN